MKILKNLISTMIVVSILFSSFTMLSFSTVAKTINTETTSATSNEAIVYKENGVYTNVAYFNNDDYVKVNGLKDLYYRLYLDCELVAGATVHFSIYYRSVGISTEKTTVIQKSPYCSYTTYVPIDLTGYGGKTDVKAWVVLANGQKILENETVKLDIEYIIASGKCGDNLNWKLNRNGKLEITGTGKMYDFSYYASNGEKDYVPWHDYIDQIESVEIGEGVTYVGADSFYQCNNLNSIDISSSVMDIDRSAFRLCGKLKEINVNSDNKYYSSFDGNLYNKDKTRLCLYAIGKSDRSFTVPDSVTTIGQYAFNGCENLCIVIIPDSVTNIQTYAFAACDNLFKITLSNNLTEIAIGMFWGCNKLTNIIIPKGVKEISSFAFQNCKNLKTISLPNSVKNIESCAFNLCDNLTDVYYYGSEYQFYSITIEAKNEHLTSANIHYVGETTTTNMSTQYSTISTTVSTKKTFLVSTLLSKASSSNITKNINEGDSYQAIITPYSGYELSNVSVKMGNIDVTPSFSKSSCIINIPKVTGDISIIAVAVMKPEESSTVESSTEEISTTIPTVATTKTTVPTTIKPTVTIPKPTPKKSQTISAKSFTKYYGDKSFSLGAKAKTKLTYKSSNNSIATVSSNGKVTIRGIGKVTITVTAVGNSSYNSATKKITINVILRPVNKNTIKIKKINKTSLNVSWSKVANVNGYNIKVSTIIKGKNFNTELKRNKTYVKMNNAKKGQKVNFLIRTYKKIGKKYYYSSWMRKNIII